MFLQATLAKPPSPYTEMMKGILLAYVLIIFAYFGVSAAGFATYGNTVNPDILLSISQPQWLVKIANLMVVVHVAASFQVTPLEHVAVVWRLPDNIHVEDPAGCTCIEVSTLVLQLFAHPVYEAAEGFLTRHLFRRGDDDEAPFLLRLAFRTLYCGFCAGITIVLPFFNDVIGLVGSAGFVPMSFIFPCLFYILTRRYRAPWEMWLNVGIICVMGTAGLLAVMASARNLIARAQTYHA